MYSLYPEKFICQFLSNFVINSYLEVYCLILFDFQSWNIRKPVFLFISSVWINHFKMSQFIKVKICEHQKNPKYATCDSLGKIFQLPFSYLQEKRTLEDVNIKVLQYN
jgi:hypothetical protein